MVSWCEFQVTPFQIVSGHQDPGVTVPELRRRPPPPAICVHLAARWKLSSAQPESEQCSAKLRANHLELCALQNGFLFSEGPAGRCSLLFQSVCSACRYIKKIFVILEI